MTTPHYNIFNRINNDISDPSSVVLSLIPSSELYYLKQPHIDGNVSHSAIVDYYQYQSSIELANYLKDLDVDYILYDKDLIEQPQYAALREVVANSERIDSYTDMVLTNRLTGATRSETLFLVRLP